MVPCRGVHHFRELILATVQLRLFCFVIGFQRCAVTRINPRIVSFRLQSYYLTEPDIGLVSTLDSSNFPCCRHWMNLGSSRKRSSQTGLHTQQFVILWLRTEHGGLLSCALVRLSSDSPPMPCRFVPMPRCTSLTGIDLG
jgi:hypothetical protein